jgi:hypothetical protein
MNVKNSDGSISTMTKSSFTNLLNDKSRMTPDRLKRYIHGKSNNSDTNDDNTDNESLIKKKFLFIGDTIFLLNDDNIVLMQVLKFQHLNRDTFKGKRFSKKSCPLNIKADIGVTGNCHVLSKDGTLVPFMCQEYFEIKDYICHFNTKQHPSNSISKQIIDKVYVMMHDNLINSIKNK